MTYLRTLFEKLFGAKIYYKKNKFTFSMTYMGYLGHVVGNGGARADQDKVSTISTQPVPESIKNMQQFMDFSSYYNRYIPHLASIALQLTKLLQNHIFFYWGDEQQHALDVIKVASTSTHMFALPDPLLP